MNQNIIDLWMNGIGISMAISMVPQIVKMIQNRSGKDISYLYFSFLAFAQINWMIYGMYMNSKPLMTTGYLCFVFSMAILVLKMGFGGKENDN